MSKLNEKQKLFCKEYLIDLNGTQAATRAGYSHRTANEQASRLLANVNIQAYVQSLMDKRSEKLEIDAEYVLGTIHSTIERCRQAEPVKGSDGTVSGEYRFDSVAVLKGCELLGKHLKLFTDKTELTGKNGGPVQIVASPLDEKI